MKINPNAQEKYSVKKSPEVTERVPQCYTSTSSATTSSVNRPIVTKQHYCIIGRKNSNVKSEVQLNVTKHVNICCCSFNKIWIRR